jgi:hypothetical protein
MDLLIVADRLIGVFSAAGVLSIAIGFDCVSVIGVLRYRQTNMWIAALRLLPVGSSHRCDLVVIFSRHGVLLPG